MEHKFLPKFTFFYLLSLVSLIFFALCSGMIVFQLIGKYVVDIFSSNSIVSASQLKFAISAILISAPVYYFSTRQIYKGLKSGKLDKESSLRRWLTYLILFASSMVVIGFLIGIVNGFLSGDLTSQFILKALTAIIISAIVFSFYLLDLRYNSKRIIKIYFFSSLVLALVILVTGFMISESPKEARAKKIDSAIVNNFSRIDYEIYTYYNKNDKLPENLDVLMSGGPVNIYSDPETKETFEYKIIDDSSYQLCANFRSTNMDLEYETRRHESGYHCLDSVVNLENDKSVMIR